MPSFPPSQRTTLPISGLLCCYYPFDTLLTGLCIPLQSTSKLPDSCYSGFFRLPVFYSAVSKPCLAILFSKPRHFGGQTGGVFDPSRSHVRIQQSSRCTTKTIGDNDKKHLSDSNPSRDNSLSFTLLSCKYNLKYVLLAVV